ncbi:unnamed protein product, partial [Heterosigma akashiwo]
SRCPAPPTPAPPTSSATASSSTPRRCGRVAGAWTCTTVYTSSETTSAPC